MTGLPPNPNDKVTFDPSKLKTIYLAGGCFWGVDAYIRRIRGVAHTQCGYAGGHKVDPTYEEVCRGDTGHAEAVRVDYDPDMLPLQGLLDVFFSIIDPTVKNRQGHDIGHQYRTGIYYLDEAERPVIEAFIAGVAGRYQGPIVTEVEPFSSYYPAEGYHQDYLEKNPGGYCHVDLGRLREE